MAAQLARTGRALAQMPRGLACALADDPGLRRGVLAAAASRGSSFASSSGNGGGGGGGPSAATPPATTVGAEAAATPPATAAAAPAAALPEGHVDMARKELVMVFTCGQCETRAAKAFSKRSYTAGVVIVTCPGCSSRHLIADHMGWFGHKGTVEDFVAEKGGVVVNRLADETLELTPEDVAGQGGGGGSGDGAAAQQLGGA